MERHTDKQQFTIAKRLLSFKYALKGILYLIKSQHNAWIHLTACLLVIFFGFYFSVTNTEWILLVLSIGIVFAAEAFNTAIELLVDKISPEYNQIAGRIKDLAAGAVLFTALAAAITGTIIFWPKIFA